MLLKCCLLYIAIVEPRHVIFCMLVSISPSRSIYVLFMWSICHYYFHFHYKFHQNFSLRVLLSFCLIFCQFEPGVVYKSVANKKKCVQRKFNAKSIRQFWTISHHILLIKDPNMIYLASKSGVNSPMIWINFGENISQVMDATCLTKVSPTYNF